LKTAVGNCDTERPLNASSASAADFVWRCEHGRVAGSVLLTPTNPPQIQSLSLRQKTP